MARRYWIVNFKTKQYFPCVDEGDFFDGDWKQKTPWPDEDYINLSAQTIWSHQVLAENAFYGYDLCRDGMLVGVYYDNSTVSRGMVSLLIDKLKRQHDVVSVSLHALKECTVQ